MSNNNNMMDNMGKKKSSGKKRMSRVEIMQLIPPHMQQEVPDTFRCAIDGKIL